MLSLLLLYACSLREPMTLQEKEQAFQIAQKHYPERTIIENYCINTFCVYTVDSPDHQILLQVTVSIEPAMIADVKCLTCPQIIQ